MDRNLLLGTALQAGAVFVLVTPAHAQPAPNAAPAGGSVIAGSAAITTSPGTTTITQSTQRAAINWQSFNIGSQQTVRFQQPSTSAATLNRIVGPNPSQIAGTIDANGQVVIVNQSGVTFYKGSQVNTAGIMVSAAGISNANFMAGRMVFDQPPNPNAAVVNAGTMTVRDEGLAALVAPRVANSGVITAKLGHVVLAGAQTATLDLYGDGLVAIDVTGQVVQAPDGATALVTNTGVIRANGGTVQLTAQAVDGVVQNLVDSSGKISAATVGNRTGTIVLAGVGGSISVTGQLMAEGRAAGSTGGNIAIDTSGTVNLGPNARVNASGQAGGGVVAIGTTLARAAGGPGVTSTQTAANVTVTAGAQIAANATVRGNGGRVAVLSGGNTTMNGSISATGGPQGGNGGFAEVSGATLGMTGTVDLAAPAGGVGTLLLDPTNLDIVNAVGTVTLLDGFLPDITYTTAPGTAAVVTNRAIDASTANVILQATNNLTVDPRTPVTMQPGVSLTMQTQTGNIVVSAGSPITTSGAGNITLQAGLTPGSGGTLTLNDNLTAGPAGRITLQADAGIALNATAVTAGTLDLSTISGGGVTQATGGSVAVTTLQSTNGIAGNASLTAAGNTIGTLGSVTVGSGTLSLFDAGPLTIAGPVNATFLNITATGQMTLAGNVTTTGAPQAQQSGTTPAPQGSTLQVIAPPPIATAVLAGTPATQFVQTGSVTISGPSGATVRIQLPASGGTATFANLNAPGVDLVLGLGSGTTSGSMQAGGLLVLGTGGSAALTRSVAGVTTAAAASLGQISPVVDPGYTFNGCTIGLAACAPPSGPPGGTTGGSPGGTTGGSPGGTTGGSPSGGTAGGGTPPGETTPGNPPVVIAGPESPLPQPVLGSLSGAGLLPGPRPAAAPALRSLNVIVVPWAPLAVGQLASPDVVPPNISFEDY